MSNNIAAKDANGVNVVLRTTDDGVGHIPHHMNGANLYLDIGTQLAANVDLLTGVVNGWLDVGDYFSGSIQISASAGVTSGAIIFEQTNDSSVTAGLPLQVTEVTAITANPLIAAMSIAASANRLFQAPITARYIRVRISTAFVGGLVRAVAFFNQQPSTSLSLSVRQATAASLLVTNTPATPTTLFRNSTASTNAVSMKASAGTLTDVVVTNTGASVAYLKLYNKASAPTVGTDIPVFTLPIPAGAPADLNFGPLGQRFSTGIAFAITAGASDADATAVAAGDIKAALTYI